jgi:hypothetical protein
MVATLREHLEAVEAVLRGIRRTIGAAKQGKAPATANLIGQMIALCPDNMIGKRDRALLCLGFAGAFRRSELCALEVADLTEVADGLRILIRRSQGDQEGRGRRSPFPEATGCARSRRCRRGWQRRRSAALTPKGRSAISCPSCWVDGVRFPPVDPCCLLPLCSLLWWRLDVARRIGRRRSCISGGLGRGIRGRADNSTYCDAGRDAAPVRSTVVVAVAAATPSAIDIHVAVRVDIRSPVGVDVCSPVRIDVPVASVSRVPMEVVAVEIAATVPAAGGTLPTTARRSLTAAAATSPVLHEDQSVVIRLDDRVKPTRNAFRREWRNWCSHGAARERHGGREQQCDPVVHFTAPDTWLEVP